jgi:hypothetical protein
MRRLLALLVLAAAALLGGCASGPQAGDDEYRAAIAMADKGDTPGAIKALEEGYAQFPKHIRMCFALARLQYETGERYHQDELNAKFAAAKLEDEGRKGEAQKYTRDAADLRAKAVPWYRGARENLKSVVAKTSDDTRAGWAYYLLMRIDVFFEEWEQALEDMERAMEKGKPQGALSAQWQDYQRQLKSQAERKKRGRNEG